MWIVGISISVQMYFSLIMCIVHMLLGFPVYVYICFHVYYWANYVFPGRSDMQWLPSQLTFTLPHPLDPSLRLENIL